MDTKQLRYFVQVVEAGSFSKASRQVYIAQPALSAQVAKLEDEVGRPLLIRSVQGVTPTESGQALYHHAKFVLRQLDEAVLVARQEPAAVQGRVTLGLAPSTACMIGLALLNQLAESHPGITLNVISALPGHLDEMARASQLDVAVLFSPTAAAGMSCEALLHEDVYLVVPDDSQLIPRSKTTLNLREIAQLPLVASSPTHSLRRRVMLEFERAGLEFRPVTEIDSLQLVMQYCLARDRATIQPRAATMALGAPQAWRCLPISDISLSRPHYLCTLPPHRMSTAGIVVQAELRRLVHDLVQTQRWQGVRLAESF
jgi:LysR family tcuABC transcriptional regulator